MSFVVIDRMLNMRDNGMCDTIGRYLLEHYGYLIANTLNVSLLQVQCELIF